MLSGNPYKRKACSECIALKARCSHTRPCDRCTRKGLECVDVVRKPRTKKPKQPPIVMNAAEIISKLLPTLSPSDLLQLNIPNLQPLSPTVTTPHFRPTPSHYLSHSSPSFSPSPTSLSPSHLSPASTSPSPFCSTSLSPSPLSSPSPLPSPPLDTLEQELFGNSDNLPDMENFHSFSSAFGLPQTAQAYPPTTYSHSPLSSSSPTSSTSPSPTSLSTPFPSHASPSPTSQSTTFLSHASLSPASCSPSPSLPATSLPSTSLISPSLPSPSPPSPSLISPSLSPSHTSVTLYSSPSSSNTLQSPADDLRAVVPQTDLPTISASPTSALSSALMNLVGMLVTSGPREAQAQVETELHVVKRAIEDFLTYAQSSRPKEINVQPPLFLANPQTFTIKDCNENLLKLIGCDDKEKILDKHVNRLCIPHFWRIIKRDISYFKSQKIDFAERYITLQHNAGGVVYAMASFHLVGPDNAVITIKNVYDDIPRCLQLAFYFYLGLSSANQKVEPQPGCQIKYCHCKMFHLPIPPPDA